MQLPPTSSTDHAAIYIGVATIIASLVGTLFAPLIALKVQKRVEERKQSLDRKLWIFKTLMANRATRLNANFVQALNMIEIEFSDPSEKDIRHAWKELLDHYTAWGAKTEPQRKLDERSDIDRSNELLAEMLEKMGRILGYDFDKVYIKKGFYYPEGLGNIEAEQHALRRRLLALLSGSGAKLPIAVFSQDFKPLVGGLANQEQPPSGLEFPGLERKAPSDSTSL